MGKCHKINLFRNSNTKALHKNTLDLYLDDRTLENDVNDKWNYLKNIVTLNKHILKFYDNEQNLKIGKD